MQPLCNPSTESLGLVRKEKDNEFNPLVSVTLLQLLQWIRVVSIHIEEVMTIRKGLQYQFYLILFAEEIKPILGMTRWATLE